MELGVGVEDPIDMVDEEEDPPVIGIGVTPGAGDSAHFTANNSTGSSKSNEGPMGVVGVTVPDDDEDDIVLPLLLDINGVDGADRSNDNDRIGLLVPIMGENCVP
jgi:hypothetical protein